MCRSWLLPDALVPAWMESAIETNQQSLALAPLFQDARCQASTFT